jgi:hypothetical protein
MGWQKEHYPIWLFELEARQLEIVGYILNIELEIYETQKLIHRLRELDEEDNFLLGEMIMSEIHLKKLLKPYYPELEEIDLDISHCRFMIDLLKRSKPDED